MGAHVSHACRWKVLSKGGEVCVLETDFLGITVYQGSFLEFIPGLPTHPSGIFLQGAPQVGVK